jgi:hypothetical protein
MFLELFLDYLKHDHYGLTYGCGFIIFTIIFFKKNTLFYHKWKDIEKNEDEKRWTKY